VKLNAAFSAQPKWLIIAEMVLLIGIIGFSDYATSWEVSLFVFYGVPIFIAAWQVGRPAGFALAFLAGVTWYIANLPTYPFKTGEGYLWAGINRLFYFGFVAVGATAMRDQRAQALERIEAITLARKLELEIVRAGEREQIRIGQDLHDGVCQNLAAIDCATECLREELEAGGLPQAVTAGKIQQYLKETIIEARNLARGIFPAQVESDGLVSALNELATKANFIREGAVQFESSGDIRIADPQVALHLYRIAQEAMSNAARHANSSRTTLSLSQKGPNLRLAVADNGIGFKADKNTLSGIGLRTMQYRAQLIGASITVTSRSGRGTTVECLLPLPVPGTPPALAAHSL
jgi:signal transduction histidine kinase